MNTLIQWLDSKKHLAPVVIRLGLALVFLLFGFKKLYDPSQTTGEIQLLINFNLGTASAINYYLGLAELSVATLLILGYKIRLVGAAAACMTTLFFISFLAKYGTSINPDIFRDIGLTGAGLALSLLGAGPWSLDNRKKNQTPLSP